jgi:iron-sulfur cluster insertion protein
MATVTPSPLSLSDNAALRLQALIAKEGKAGLKLRVSVSGGGCSGFQYHFDLDDKTNDDDLVVEKNGVAAVIDNMSLMYLLGSEIDFVESLSGSAFSVRNPNATSSCGCGTSFAV